MLFLQPSQSTGNKQEHPTALLHNHSPHPQVVPLVTLNIVVLLPLPDQVHMKRFLNVEQPFSDWQRDGVDDFTQLGAAQSQHHYCLCEWKNLPDDI